MSRGKNRSRCRFRCELSRPKKLLGVLGVLGIVPGKGDLAAGDISRPIVKYRVCGQYSQSYSVGGSSDAAFWYQYCSNLLLLWLFVVTLLAVKRSSRIIVDGCNRLQTHTACSRPVRAMWCEHSHWNTRAQNTAGRSVQLKWCERGLTNTSRQSVEDSEHSV